MGSHRVGHDWSDLAAAARRPRWESRRLWTWRPPMNTSKIHLYVEQFSLKTHWKLVEELLYNQGCKKKNTYNWVGRKEKQASQDLWPWEGNSGKRGFYGQTLILRQITNWASHSWGPAWRRQTPFAGWRTVGTDRKHEEGGTPCKTSVCTLVSPEARWTEVCWAAAGLPVTASSFAPAGAKQKSGPTCSVPQCGAGPEVTRTGGDCALGVRGDSVLSWPHAPWWPLLAPTQQHPRFVRAATVSYSLTSHPSGVKENHTGPASPVEHRRCWRLISCERHRGLAPTAGQRVGCCSGCMVSCDHLISRHSPGEADTLASLSPCLSTALDLGRCGQGKTWPCAVSSGTTDAYTGSALGSFTHRNLTCFTTPLRGQNSWCGERRRHTHSGDGASSCLTHRSSTPQRIGPFP